MDDLTRAKVELYKLLLLKDDTTDNDLQLMYWLALDPSIQKILEARR